MKILIVDNEAPIRKGLVSLVKVYCESITHIEEADSVASANRKLVEFSPDIVLLDVEMEDGTGFDLLRKLSSPSFQLIFVTAHDKYALEAFQFSAIDYLLKPVDPESFRKSMERAILNVNNLFLKRQVEVLLQQLSGIQSKERKIVLKDIENTYFVKIASILYCEAEGTYTRFFLEDGEPILVSRNLKEYASMLEPLGFIRTHHSFLVNPDKIRLYDKTDGGMLVLESGSQVPVSQRKKESVMQILECR